MTDSDLCRAFGTTLEDVERDVEEFEHGDWSKLSFGEPVDGRPRARMRSTSLKLYDYELAAIDRAAKTRGMSRSAFIRKAISDELVEMS